MNDTEAIGVFMGGLVIGATAATFVWVLVLSAYLKLRKAP